MENNTGLYIRRRSSGELWQLFIGGGRKTKPSELYQSYLDFFKELHSDYEWVVLERRWDERRHTAMYRIGSDKKVAVHEDKERPEWQNHRFRRKEVECLSLWHMDEEDKLFQGSISKRMCPICIEKEFQFLYNRGGL